MQGHIQSLFEQYLQISRGRLYDLCAKGNYQTGSNIDLAIDGDTLTLADLFESESLIGDLLLPWNVDL
jgi:hypothetical protein